MAALDVLVRKCNLRGEETWRYTGRILQQGRHSVLLEARFNRPDLPFHGIVLRENDRFVEWYSSERWYNLFEVHDRDDDRVKCWYCNISRPAVFTDGVISYVDLALDLLVLPDGHMLVLDEDEFAELDLEETTRAKARQGLAELQRVFDEKEILSFGVQILMV
jgi:predicted RNA-binding protein associated with RNAse of E/G family